MTNQPQPSMPGDASPSPEMAQGTLSADFVVPAEDEGQRLDVFLAQRLPQFSRTHLRRAIDRGTVLVDGVRTKVAYKLLPGQTIEIEATAMPRQSPLPENIPLEILFEDAHLAAINKPPGMVVHPAKGHWSGTLTSALAYHFSTLSSIGGATRPGIVHRLDRDTSGVIVVAKTDEAHARLAAQFEARQVFKQYFAICRGEIDRDRDRVDQPIGAHPHHREKMAIRGGHETSRDARTEYEVVERFRGFTCLHAFPKTGRTHQIRLHLTHIGCPVACDKLYGGHDQITVADLDRSSRDDTTVIQRQALHALRLRIDHPLSGQPLEIEAPMPSDMADLIAALKKYRSL